MKKLYYIIYYIVPSFLLLFHNKQRKLYSRYLFLQFRLHKVKIHEVYCGVALLRYGKRNKSVEFIMLLEIMLDMCLCFIKGPHNLSFPISLVFVKLFPNFVSEKEKKNLKYIFYFTVFFLVDGEHESLRQFYDVTTVEFGDFPHEVIRQYAESKEPLYVLF